MQWQILGALSRSVPIGDRSACPSDCRRSRRGEGPWGRGRGGEISRHERALGYIALWLREFSRYSPGSDPAGEERARGRAGHEQTWSLHGRYQSALVPRDLTSPRPFCWRREDLKKNCCPSPDQRLADMATGRRPLSEGAALLLGPSLCRCHHLTHCVPY